MVRNAFKETEVVSRRVLDNLRRIQTRRIDKYSGSIVTVCNINKNLF